MSWARMALDTSARASSSSTMAASTSPRPAPPHSSPTVIPKRSACLNASHEACGNSSVSSQCWARGASSRSATSRANLRSVAWSSVSANGSMPDTRVSVPSGAARGSRRVQTAAVSSERRTGDPAPWTYVAGAIGRGPRTPAKPYVHPLRTPSGHCLTRVEPPDHRWHRGLWFTIKFVNGENFWEEEEPYGTQVHVDPNRIEWLRPNGDVVLREHRVLHHEPLSDGAYALDWSSVITAAVDAELDRTPFRGWGGYGGLTLRGRADWCDTRLLLAGGARPASGCWARRRAGAISRVRSTVRARVWRCSTRPPTRHPVPWYASTRSAVYGDDGWSNFLNAALLFDPPCARRWRGAAGRLPRHRARRHLGSGARRRGLRRLAAYEGRAGSASSRDPTPGR